MVWAHLNYPSIIHIHLLSLTKQNTATLSLFLISKQISPHMTIRRLRPLLGLRRLLPLRHRLVLPLIQTSSVLNLQLTVHRPCERLNHSLL